MTAYMYDYVYVYMRVYVCMSWVHCFTLLYPPICSGTFSEVFLYFALNLA